MAGALIYLVGLPEHKHMLYNEQIKALWRGFGQKTETCNALYELSFKRGQNQLTKESTVASWAYHSYNYVSG